MMRMIVRLGILAIALLVLGRLEPVARITHASEMANNTTLTMGNCLTSTTNAYSLCAGILFSNYYGVEWDGHIQQCNQSPWTTAHDECAYWGVGNHWGNQDSNAWSGGFLSMQTDGNLVLYNESLQAVWATNTSGYGSSAFLNMQDDGNLVVYYNTNVPIWSLF